MVRKFVLLGDDQRRRAAEYILVQAQLNQEVLVRDAGKSRGQEEKYHALIGEIADQFQFCNRKWDAESMKRLLIDQFKRDTINDDEFKELWKAMNDFEMAPALDGSGVVMLGTQSRRFPKKLASAFVEWLYAFGAENCVRFSQ